MTVRLFRCGVCRDVGWVAVDAVRNVVKPCPSCRQALFARWSAGEFDPDFRLVRSGDVPDARMVAEGLGSCRSLLKTGPARDAA